MKKAAGKKARKQVGSPLCCVHGMDRAEHRGYEWFTCKCGKSWKWKNGWIPLKVEFTLVERNLWRKTAFGAILELSQNDDGRWQLVDIGSEFPYLFASCTFRETAERHAAQFFAARELWA